MKRMHVGIAGAGLLGRLLAWQLSARGHQVSVFDPSPDGVSRAPGTAYAAGWTAAGMLSPLAELECADARVAQYGLRSLDLWQDTVSRLPGSIDFRRQGSLLLAHRPDVGAAQRILDVLRAKAPGAHFPRSITLPDLRQMEPSIHGPAHAWLLEQEGQIHTVQTMLALADGATRQGAQWHWGHPVERLGPGVLEAGGASHRFDWVFDVRGIGARPDLPVRGVRGEVFWLHAPGVLLGRPVRLLHPRWRVYIVPRPGEQVVVGASEVESEDRSPVSVRTTLGLLSAAHSVIPELAEARIVHTESNLRPALPDNLPVIETREGLTRINGLFRHGWLIAPAMVEEALLQLPDAGTIPPQTQKVAA